MSKYGNRLARALELSKQHLPEGWYILCHLENGIETIQLYDYRDDEHDFRLEDGGPSPDVASLIEAAVFHAVGCDARMAAFEEMEEEAAEESEHHPFNRGDSLN